MNTFTVKPGSHHLNQVTKVSTISNGTNRNHVPHHRLQKRAPCRYCDSPSNVRNLDLIMKRHQTNQIERHFCKITGPQSSKGSKSWTLGKDWGYGSRIKVTKETWQPKATWNSELEPSAIKNIEHLAKLEHISVSVYNASMWISWFWWLHYSYVLIWKKVHTTEK